MTAIDVKRFAAGLGMGAYDRVQGLIFGPRIVAAVIAYAVFASLRHIGLGGGIDRDEAVEQIPQPRRQSLVGEIHVGEQRVAAIGRHLARHEHRAHRRLFEIGRVAMPQPAEIDPLVFELDDRRDLGEAVDALDERVLDRLAEMPRQAEQFGGRQVLVAKEDHEVV